MLRTFQTPVLFLMLLIACCSAYADKVDDYIRQKMANQHIPGLSGSGEVGPVEVGSMANQHIPGLSLAVLRDGKIVKTIRPGRFLKRAVVPFLPYAGFARTGTELL